MPPLAAVPDLDRELDELYALPLADFTKGRNDLAVRLRKAHQAEAADAVRALKKPTVAAWTANRLARAHPDLVRALVDAGTLLRDAQQRSLAGKASQSEVAEAATRERNAVRVLVTTARDDPGSRVTAPLLDRLAQTLRAAAVDGELAATLVSGRLTEELQAVGFGPLEAVPPTSRRRQDDGAKAALERVKQLREDARRLALEARDAARAAADAERAAGVLREEADGRQAAADRAAEELAEAEDALS